MVWHHLWLRNIQRFKHIRILSQLWQSIGFCYIFFESINGSLESLIIIIHLTRIYPIEKISSWVKKSSHNSSQP
jgi:hypothetical protein